jgi:hypothetical protein
MESLTRIMSGELFMTVALVAVPVLVARAFAWWRGEAERHDDERYAAAVEALEVGVHEAWERFGRAWKGAHSDGKLTDDERGRLRTVAREVAVEAGRDAGVDVVAALGKRAIGALIRKIVERRKRGE